MPPTPPDLSLARRYLASPEADDKRLAAALASADDDREAAWRLAGHAGRLLGLSDCVIYLVDAGSGQLRQMAAWGPKQVAPRIFENPILLAIGQGIVGTCARDRAPVLVADTRLDPRYIVDDEVRLSELAVPMLSGERLLGVIDTEHAACDAYRSEHVRALLQLGSAFGKYRLD